MTLSASKGRNLSTWITGRLSVTIFRYILPISPYRELDKYQVAIFGVPEDRNGFIKGSKDAPDDVRNKLYQLVRINRGLQIYDLGNVKTGGAVNDTYFALRDIILELKERQITALILGGSQDLSQGSFLALEKEEWPASYTHH